MLSAHAIFTHTCAETPYTFQHPALLQPLINPELICASKVYLFHLFVYFSGSLILRTKGRNVQKCACLSLPSRITTFLYRVIIL